MRAEIAASLLHQPKVLFLDEPTIGLDVVARQELRDLLRDWNRQEGMTIFLTSHDAGDIESVAQRAIVINHGRLILDEPVESVRSRFLTSKILAVKFHQVHQPFSMEGVNVLSTAHYSLQLQVDTSRQSIESVIENVLKAAPVADITIEDPPLEEVISHIYGLSLEDFRKQDV